MSQTTPPTLINADESRRLGDKDRLFEADLGPVTPARERLTRQFFVRRLEEREYQIDKSKGSRKGG